MITELYDALKDAGGDEEKARKAAETVAAQEDRYGKIEIDLAEIKGKLTLITWAVGINAAATIASFGMLWQVAAALGRLAKP
jgi:hypothetical protein